MHTRPPLSTQITKLRAITPIPPRENGTSLLGRVMSRPLLRVAVLLAEPRGRRCQYAACPLSHLVLVATVFEMLRVELVGCRSVRFPMRGRNHNDNHRNQVGAGGSATGFRFVCGASGFRGVTATSCGCSTCDGPILSCLLAASNKTVRRERRSLGGCRRLPGSTGTALRNS